jgi:hypothetical protein
VRLEFSTCRNDGQEVFFVHSIGKLNDIVVLSVILLQVIYIGLFVHSVLTEKGFPATDCGCCSNPVRLDLC